MKKSSNKNFKPRILFLVQLPPPIHGVSTMNTHVIESNIINQNFDINVIDLRFVNSMDQLQKFSISKVVTALKYCFEIVNKMLIFKPALVYFTIMPTGFGFYRDAFYVFILKIFKVKILLHLHGKGILKNSNNLVKKNIYKWVFKDTYIICLTERLTEDISEVYRDDPFIVPNGIEVQPKINGIINRSNRSIPQILFLSNYTRNKGILVLVEALSILKNQGYIFNARFVGAPFDISIEFLQNTIDHHKLTEVAEVLGPLYDEDKFLEFQKADIFVFPTYNDVFGLVNLEAMQYSLPVVSTFEGSIPDIVIDNETGFVVETQNAQMLAEKIALLLKDKDLRIEMGKKGYERFINNFTLDQFITNINKTFQDILSSN